MNQSEWLKDEVQRCHRWIECKIIEAANMEAELAALLASIPDPVEISKPFDDYLRRFWAQIDASDIERALIRMMSADVTGRSPQFVACVARTIARLTTRLEKGGAN